MYEKKPFVCYYYKYFLILQSRLEIYYHEIHSFSLDNPQKNVHLIKQTNLIANLFSYNIICITNLN